MLEQEPNLQSLEEVGEKAEPNFTGDKVDLNLLPPEAQTIYKDWQKKYTTKRQTETEEIRQMQEELANLKAQNEEYLNYLSSLNQPTEEEPQEEDEISKLINEKVSSSLAEFKAEKELEEARRTLPYFNELAPDITKVLEKYGDISYQDAYWLAAQPYILNALQNQKSSEKPQKEFHAESGGTGVVNDDDDKELVNKILNAHKNINSL